MRLGIRLNTKIAAPTQWAVPFSSLVNIGGHIFGSGDGLYRVSGDLDDNDLTEESMLEPSLIHSEVKLLTTDFGSPNYKRFRWIQVGYESVDSLTLTVTSNEGDEEDYELPALVTTGAQVGQRIPIHRTLVGRYFSLKIFNHTGCHFTLDSITAAINILPQKPRG